jgi:CBS domain-containing protein
MTQSVGGVIRSENPVCMTSETLTAAMVEMTKSGLGAVTLVDSKGAIEGVFTDGDLRRSLQQDGNKILEKTLDQIGFSRSPVTIEKKAFLDEAVKLFHDSKVDSIVVINGQKPFGVLDIQDLIKLGLLGQKNL